MFRRDGSWDIIEVECGWEWKALEVETMKQGSGGGAVLDIGLQTVEVDL